MAAVAVSSAAQSDPASSPELVRQAVANELGSPFVAQNCSYQYHRQVSGKQETLVMIKSTELLVGKLVRVDNAPISQDREEKEDQHLRQLLANAAEQEQERKRQLKFEEHMRALVGAIPQAFHFTETQTEVGPEGHKLVHLRFQPAADFRPPGIDLEVLRGLTGTMIIDETEKQIVKLEAYLFRDVDFGWGIVARLNKGGTLMFVRDATEERISHISEFSLNVNGRVLLLKRFEIHWNFDHFACFRQPIAVASAIAMLTSRRISLVSSQ